MHSVPSGLHQYVIDEIHSAGAVTDVMIFLSLPCVEVLFQCVSYIQLVLCTLHVELWY